jgi:membrane protein implicated in regulation of membrane protease activity
MDPWLAWLLAALLLGVLEMVTGGTLVLIMLAGGALAGSVTAAVTDSTYLPWIVFAAVSVGLPVAVRPVAARHTRQPAALRSGVDRLVGEEAEVISAVDGHDGRVKLHGEVWSAKAFDGQTTFAPGQRVHVLQIEGATALVG